MEGGERAGQEPATDSDRGEGQTVKPKDSPRGTAWRHQRHHHTQLHKVQGTPPKPVHDHQPQRKAAEVSRVRYWHPLPGSWEPGLEGRGCKHGCECEKQKYSFFSVSLVLKCRHLFSQPVSPELCNVIEAMVDRDVAVQEGKGVFAVHPQLLSLCPVMERGSENQPLNWERKEGLGWAAQIWWLLTDPWKMIRA